MPRRQATTLPLSLLGIFVLLHISLVGLFIVVAQPSAWSSRINRAQTPTAKFSWDALPPRKKLEWHDCFPNRQCARLIVPLDHSNRSGREAVIALIRKPSLFPLTSESYNGPILFNPGGPGGSGVDMIQGPGGDLLSTIVGPQFDVVGFDPRGIGRSTPRASFFPTAIEREFWTAGESFVANTSSSEGVARTWARAHLLGQLAARNDDGGLRYLNTEQTARDMLSIV
ncbi:hypothetical protein BJ912DRAFT_1082081 [Pholiota molesta]|nr:hypothetical protein BJ912DRAFT_1082081 [Pholiota molesta]